MKTLLYSIIIIGISSRLFFDITDASSSYIYALTPCCLDALGIGSLLAYYFVHEPATLKKILSNGYLFIGAFIVFIFLTIYLDFYVKDYIENRTVLQRFLFSIGCFWIIGYATLNGFNGFIKYILENRFIIFIGKISYGIYIYHDFAFSLLTTYLDPYLITHFHISPTWFFNPAFTNNNMLLTAILLFIFTLIISSISWYFIELPISKLRKNIKY